MIRLFLFFLVSVFCLSYRGTPKGRYGNIRQRPRVHSRKVEVVSQAEQDRRFREASAYEVTHFLPKQGSLRSVRARLVTHKLYGVTH